MNNENSQSDSFHIDASQCEIFEPLISAMLDGEMTQAEHDELISTWTSVRTAVHKSERFNVLIKP